MSDNSDDDNYAWLDRHSSDPRTTPSPTEPTPETIEQAAPASATIEGPGGITYTDPEAGQPGVHEIDYSSAPGQATGAQPVPPMSPMPPMSSTTPAPPRAPAPRAPQKRSFGGGFIRRLGWRAAIAAVVLIGGLVLSRGTTGADNLGVGDCFEIPDTTDSTRVRRVDDQDCDGPHEAQVYAQVVGPASIANDACFEAFLDLDTANLDQLPADVEWATLGDTSNTDCIILSPSGQLIGSITPD